MFWDILLTLDNEVRVPVFGFERPQKNSKQPPDKPRVVRSLDSGEGPLFLRELVNDRFRNQITYLPAEPLLPSRPFRLRPLVCVDSQNQNASM